MHPCELHSSALSYDRVSSSGEGGWGGEASPSKYPALPPKREKKEKRERREREKERKKEREIGGGGRGACIFLHRSVSDQYSPLLHDSII